MIRLNDSELAFLIEEDVPYMDITTDGLDLRCRAEIEFFTKNSDITVSGTEEAGRICVMLGLDVSEFKESGRQAAKGERLLKAEGGAQGVNKAWKVCQNLLEYCGGIATFTEKMVSEARKYNKNIQILTTRKMMPGTKKLALNAVMAGGGLPHRLGLSDSALVFKAHRELCGCRFEERFKLLKSKFCEHKIIAEAENPDEAEFFAALGADVIQCEKFGPDELKNCVSGLKKRYPHILVSATGGINLENAGRYAACGVDMLVTSKPYHAAPVDIKVKITPVS